MIHEEDMVIGSEDRQAILRNTEIFDGLLRKTEREGIEDVISYLHEKTDFYIAPASTRFHGNYPGGLLQHSLHVFECLRYKLANPFFRERLSGINMGSIVISALLHDICKANFYAVEMRNKKIGGSWQQVPSYTVQDDYPFGHGEKSVLILTNTIGFHLEEFELFAIRWHMGYTEPQENWKYIDRAMDLYPLALALHEADQEATHYLDETRS